MVRSSKYRHVFGQPAKKENCYEGFRPTNCAFEGTFIAANGKWIAVCVESGGSGTFMILSHETKGRLDVEMPKISAHKEYVLDLAWSPYDDDMIASCSEDGSIKLWMVPEGGITSNLDGDDAAATLDYHQKKCVQIAWHPVAGNVLLSVSQDPKICVWDCDDGEVKTDIDCPSLCWNASWSSSGDKIVSSFKDKKFRIYDARKGEILLESDGHEGSKPQRVIFTLKDKYLFSCGFSKMSERQYACWNAETLECMNLEELDTANGCLIPYYDPDTEIVYVAAKGDSVIRYYELEDSEDSFHYITTFQSNASQRGLAPIPKREVDVNGHEVYRFYKLYGEKKTGYIEPVSFIVPRKSDIFQDDIYPDTIGPEPALTAAEWFEGKNSEPNRYEMSTKFAGKVNKKGPSGGGLKKGGGLKGLKAKKDAKVAAKAASSSESSGGEKSDATEAATPAPAPAPAAEAPVEKAPAKPSPSAPSSSSGGGGVDDSVIAELKAEVAKLKKEDEKREGELKQLKENDQKRANEVKQLIDRLQEYERNMGELRTVVDGVKQNDERITELEKLTEEEDDE